MAKIDRTKDMAKGALLLVECQCGGGGRGGSGRACAAAHLSGVRMLVCSIACCDADVRLDLRKGSNVLHVRQKQTQRPRLRARAQRGVLVHALSSFCVLQRLEELVSTTPKTALSQMHRFHRSQQTPT
eukprot:6201942-Pleurochrysis_carterae.AAC.2